MTQTTAINEKISLDDAYHLNCIMRGLNGKSRCADLQFVAWNLRNSYVCQTHKGIEEKINALLSPAIDSRRQAVKQAAIDAVNEYIVSITK